MVLLSHLYFCYSLVCVIVCYSMILEARKIARKRSTHNVSFRLGEIEHLPVADNSVDVVVSNCVINLSLDKAQVFAEMHRVLRPGGRIAICDVVKHNEATMPVALQSAQAAAC